MIDFNDAKYTQKKIEAELLSRVPDTIDKRQGSMIQTALGPVAWYLEGIYMLLAQVQENAYAGSAVGEYLDNIVAERGVSRKLATSAHRKGTFDIEVPEGTVFKTINGANSVLFEVGDQIEASDGAYTYELICCKPGLIGNAYSGSILPVTPGTGIKSAVIGEILIPGTAD